MSQINNKGDLGAAWDRLLRKSFVNILGCTIELKGDGFVYSGVWYATRELVIKAIQKDISKLGNSIKDKK